MGRPALYTCRVLALLFSLSAAATPGFYVAPVDLPSGGGGTKGFDTSFLTDNKGSFAYSSPLQLAQGRNGFAPQLSFRYDSGSGNGDLGLGWSLEGVPSIRRNLTKGTPRYNAASEATSEFISSEAGELVRVGNNLYRPKASFTARVFRFLPREGYWIEWTADGRRRVYGLTGARVEQDSKVFEWHISADLDSTCNALSEPDCNRISYEYASFSNESPASLQASNLSNSKIYLSRISYNYTNGTPLSSINFEYEAARPDPIIDLRPGFLSYTAHRLKQITILHQQRSVYSYSLDYLADDHTTSFSTLGRIRSFGNSGAEFPSLSFGYSKTPTDSFEQSTLNGISQNIFATSDNASNVMVMDMDGDARPDIYLQKGGRATYLPNQGVAADGTSVQFGPEKSFSGEPIPNLNDSLSFFADIDADGVIDLISSRNGFSKRLNAHGSWTSSTPISLPLGVNVRFSNSFLFDLNGDGLADILYRGDSPRDTCFLAQANKGWADRIEMPQGNLPREIFAGSSYVRTADVNGDGLVDFVLVSPQGLRVWLSLGNCSFAKPFDISISGFSHFYASPKENFYLTDIDGDGMADLVSAYLDRIVVWKNINGTDFIQIAQTYLPRPGTAFFMGDFDGNGIADIGYCSRGLQCSYLSFQRSTKSGLLTQITSDLGWERKISYKPSTSYYGQAWKSTIPFVTQVVSKSEVTDGLALNDGYAYSYRDAYYDPTYRRFNGFRQVAISRKAARFGGKITRPVQWERRTFDLGVPTELNDGTFYARAGQLLSDGFLKQRISRHQQELSVDALGVIRPFKNVDRNILSEGSQRIEVFSNTEFDGESRPVKTTLFKTHLLSSSENESEPSTPQVLRLTQREYTPTADASNLETIADRWFSNVGREVTVDAQNKVLSERLLSYQSQTGNLSEEQQRISEGRYQSTRFRYDGRFAKNLIAKLDGNNAMISQTAYDSSGLTVIGQANGASEWVTTSYDPATGLLLTSQDPNGTLAQNSYDGRYQLIRQLTVKGSQVLGQKEWEHKDSARGILGQEFEKTYLDANGHSRSTWSLLTPGGQLVQKRVEGPQNSLIVAADRRYDSTGALALESLQTQQINAAATWNLDTLPRSYRTYQYDALDRPFHVSYPLEGLSEDFSYGIASSDSGEPCLLESTTDKHPNKNVIQRCNDIFGNTVVTAYPSSSGTSIRYGYSFDAVGRLTEIRLPSGDKRQYRRDSLGRLASLQDSQAGTHVYAYDQRGRLASDQWNGTRIWEYSYDAADRKVLEVKRDTVSGSQQTSQFFYGNSAIANNIGRLASVSYSLGQDRFSYDPAGRVLSKERTIKAQGTTRSFTFGFEWSLDGRLERETIDGTPVAYDYDPAGYLASISDILSSIEYDSAARPSGLNFANGVTRSIEFDTTTSFPKSVSIEHGSISLRKETYSFDAVGNLLRRTTQGDWLKGNSREETFAYDANDVRYGLSAFSSPEKSESYNLDVANIRTNAPFRQSWGNPSHDAFGQLQAKGAFSDLGFNEAGMLTRARAQGAHETSEFLYDYLGDKVAKLTNGRVSKFYLAKEFELEIGSGGETRQLNYFFNDEVIATRRIQGSSTETRFLMSDYMGSIVMSLDERGHVASSHAYTPWGEELSKENSAGEFFGYAGNRFDSSLGAYHMGARVYLPSLSEFISADTAALEASSAFLADPSQLNLHAYAKGNPLKFIDRDGHFGIGTVGRMLYQHLTYSPQVPFNSGAAFPSFSPVDLIVAPIFSPSAVSGALVEGLAKENLLKSLAVETPHFIASQSLDEGALLLREQAIYGKGLFKMGLIGESEVVNSQFWASESPLLEPNYLQKYGLPFGEADFSNPNKMPFLLNGSAKNGTEFITRPSSAIGRNLGGAPEVVSKPGGMKLNWFHMLDREDL